MPGAGADHNLQHAHRDQTPNQTYVCSHLMTLRHMKASYFEARSLANTRPAAINSSCSSAVKVRSRRLAIPSAPATSSPLKIGTTNAPSPPPPLVPGPHHAPPP